MAAGDRTDSIVSQAQYHLASVEQGKLSGLLKNLPPTFFYDKLQQAQTRVAAEFLCIEKKSTTITMTSGVVTEPTGFFRMKQFVLSSTDYCQPVEISVQDYDSLTRAYFTAGQAPQFFFRWAGSMTFYPVPTDATYTMYYYGIPTTTVSTIIDPETPAYFDECLLWYVLKEAADVIGRADLASQYHGKYERSREDIMGMWRRTKTESTAIMFRDI